MSEKLFRFLVSEIKSMRVICKNKDCGTVLEIPLKKLEDGRGEIQCPVCKNWLQKGGINCHLSDLAAALDRFSKLDYVDVEFTLPDVSKTTEAS